MLEFLWCLYVILVNKYGFYILYKYLYVLFEIIINIY